MKIRKGDNVKVIAGKDKGKSGKISRAFPNSDRVLIDGVNVSKRHQRPRKENQQGQIVEKAMPIHVSNVMLIDPKTGKVTRVGYKIVTQSKSGKKNKKVRIALKSKTELDS